MHLGIPSNKKIPEIQIDGEVRLSQLYLEPSIEPTGGNKGNSTIQETTIENEIELLTPVKEKKHAFVGSKSFKKQIQV